MIVRDLGIKIYASHRLTVKLRVDVNRIMSHLSFFNRTSIISSSVMFVSIRSNGRKVPFHFSGSEFRAWVFHGSFYSFRFRASWISNFYVVVTRQEMDTFRASTRLFIFFSYLRSVYYYNDTKYYENAIQA